MKKLELLADIKKLWTFRWVSISSVQSTLKVRYKRSFLGFFWSLLGPVISYGIMGTVFYLSARVEMTNYFSYFFPAVITYAFINSSISQCAASLIYNEHYIKKVALPKIIFPLNSLLSELLTYLMNLAALTILSCLISQVELTWKLILLPIYILPVALFTLGIGTALSVVSVYFRDVTHILPLLMQASLYLTPIFYPVTIIPEKYRLLMNLNPFSHFIDGIRVAFNSAPFNLTNLILIYLLATIGAVIGFLTIKRNENQILFRL